jgi:hypothetical protein
MRVIDWKAPGIPEKPKIYETILVKAFAFAGVCTVLDKMSARARRADD